MFRVPTNPGLQAGLPMAAAEIPAPNSVSLRRKLSVLGRSCDDRGTRQRTLISAGSGRNVWPLAVCRACAQAARRRCSSMVEHGFRKAGVKGSSPFIGFQRVNHFRFGCGCCLDVAFDFLAGPAARRPSAVDMAPRHAVQSLRSRSARIAGETLRFPSMGVSGFLVDPSVFKTAEALHP